MGRHLEASDDWDEGCDCGGHESDYGDEDDSTIPCPYCGKEMYEDSPRCPHCGQYISDEDTPPNRTPWWIIVGVLLCFCAIAVWIVRW
jgi:hypothetical protein